MGCLNIKGGMRSSMDSEVQGSRGSSLGDQALKMSKPIIGAFLKIRDTFSGVPLIRIIVCWVHIRGPPT